MPFGLTNAPALFQALINDMLRLCLKSFACAYLNNVVVYSKTLKEHIWHMQEILKQLQARGLYVQKEKCKFHKKIIEFLGIVISRGFIQIDPKKVKLVASWPELVRLKHLQAFLEFANLYRRLIKDYS